MEEITIKGQRIVNAVGESPSVVIERELLATREAIGAYLHGLVDGVLAEEDTTDEATTEPHQDSQQVNQRENPKANRRVKPTRKGHTSETEEG